MSLSPTKRIRDPIHGLVVFDLSDEIDQAAWALIDAPEFQRLRRVKQLGVSEFTFPGATHTRFAHCIGVFHVARRLMKVAERSLAPPAHNRHRMRVALLSIFQTDKSAGTIVELGDLELKRGAQIIARLGAIHSTILELAATIHWLIFVEKVQDWRSELKRRKGAKTDGGRTERAVGLLLELGVTV